MSPITQIINQQNQFTKDIVIAFANNHSHATILKIFVPYVRGFSTVRHFRMCVPGRSCSCTTGCAWTRRPSGTTTRGSDSASPPHLRRHRLPQSPRRPLPLQQLPQQSIRAIQPIQQKKNVHRLCLVLHSISH